MKQPSHRFRSGMATVYFLGIFLFASSLITLITVNVQYRLRTLQNLKEEMKYLAAENSITRYIQCELANERLEEINVVFGDNRFAIQPFEHQITVTISGEITETLIYELHNQKIYDYSVIR